jgi:hypothetical protein|tara:strand:+ start:62 stop:271 length:210 start_codon:yes stop_codon:yes gene_type:complete
MKNNIKKGIFRIYLLIWAFWSVLGFSDFFYKGELEISGGKITEFLILAIIVPLVILFATKWIVKGFEGK